MAFGPASRLGIALFEDTDPIDLWPNRSNEEVETVIRSVYKQVLGNANELPYLKITLFGYCLRKS
ncbi:hypothetical protein [Nostoc sp.]|uniref:hypothetical protein n=1 Tax=Nostoc sp. TaxID=1180 RepID=UPI002FF8D48F